MLNGLNCFVVMFVEYEKRWPEFVSAVMLRVVANWLKNIIVVVEELIIVILIAISSLL